MSSMRGLHLFRTPDDNEALLLGGMAAMASTVFDATAVLCAMEELAQEHFPDYVGRLRAVQQHISDASGILADICADERKAKDADAVGIDG